MVATLEICLGFKIALRHSCPGRRYIYIHTHTLYILRGLAKSRGCAVAIGKLMKKIDYCFQLTVSYDMSNYVKLSALSIKTIPRSLTLLVPSSKVWHRCRFKPPNCRLARAARVVCAPGPRA